MYAMNLRIQRNIHSIFLYILQYEQTTLEVFSFSLFSVIEKKKKHILRVFTLLKTDK